MRIVVQRVSGASVRVEGRVTGEIGPGLVLLVAVGREDTAATASAMAEKAANLRIFNDDAGKMNRSLLDTGGAVLAISQFTLYGDARGQTAAEFSSSGAAGIGEGVVRRICGGDAGAWCAS